VEEVQGFWTHKTVHGHRPVFPRWRNVVIVSSNVVARKLRKLRKCIVEEKFERSGRI
jgi:hypothetical protein